jgi:hypothetical protein
MVLRKCVLILVAGALLAAKKPKPEKTEVLALPKDPPMVAAGDTGRLVFTVSPLSGKGLLSQQTRDAIKAITRASGGAEIIHIRAFVAGSGDLRRVPQIVSEELGKKASLPSVSVVQVGGLPLVGAQIVLEGIAESRNKADPVGLDFLPATEALDTIKNPVAVSCFVSDLNGSQKLSARFPGAAFNVVQTQRLPARSLTTCQAVVRSGEPARVMFTGTQIAAGGEERDAKLAFQRLGRDLGEAQILSTNIYATTPAAAELARRDASGVISVLPVEGVASMEGSFAADAVARRN